MSALRPRRDRGFTLLELLVAAAILALIAVFSWRGLDALLRERETITSSQATVDAVSRVFARIERDALLARDAELSDDGELRLIANPAAATESAAVLYRWSNGQLVRAVVDDGSAPLVLMSDVAAGTFDLFVPGPGKSAGWTRNRTVPADAPTQLGAPSPQQNANPSTTNPQANPAQPRNDGNVAAAVPGTDAAGRPPTPPPQFSQGATGLRVAIARPDGTALVRIVMIGGGG